MEVDVDAALERQNTKEVVAMETDQSQKPLVATDESKEKKFKENKDGVKRDGSFKESKKSFKKSFRGLLDSRKKAKDLAGNLLKHDFKTLDRALVE